jgi:ADP-heptose:LPS heptosyltransferase
MRTLVYRTGHLGDTVCAIPAFRALREQFAGDEFLFLHDHGSGQAVVGSEVVGGLGIFQHSVGYRAGRGLKSFGELAVKIRELRVDRLVGLPQRAEGIERIRQKRAFFRMLGVSDVLGFDKLLPEAELRWNEPWRLLEILRGFGLRSEHRGYQIPVCELAAERVEKWLGRVGVREPFVLFCGGGKTSSQRWPLNRYGLVLREFVAKTSVQVVALGTSREADIYRREVAPLFPQLLQAPLDWGILEMIELLRESAVYIGNDTGPMHVAAAVGCPVFVVMSSRNFSGAWDPDIEPRRVMKRSVECEGCFLSECPLPGRPCLDGITVQETAAELLQFVALHGLLRNGVRERNSARDSGRSWNASYGKMTAGGAP